ncbi:hypothetical protein BHE74_00049670 [Ensete ventricosum]|nr:hypothetical protein GW17_00060406 [Ensete ventricosum]RWW44557.1 hypothetical protein BHE74_00049670 [Ensete ventricosum]
MAFKMVDTSNLILGIPLKAHYEGLTQTKTVWGQGSTMRKYCWGSLSPSWLSNSKEALEEERHQVPNLEKGVIATYKVSDEFRGGLLRSRQGSYQYKEFLLDIWMNREMLEVGLTHELAVDLLWSPKRCGSKRGVEPLTSTLEVGPTVEPVGAGEVQ